MSESGQAGPNDAYLSLGSNIEPERHLPAAVRAIGRYGRLVRASSVWESSPADGTDQANYLNAAVLLQTQLTAREVCERLAVEVEESLGRVRDPEDKFASRTIDVDLSLFTRAVLRVGHRHIPDPDILTRPFVALPLAEIAPAYVHPLTGATLQQIAETRKAAGPAIFVRPEVTATLQKIVVASKTPE